MEFQSLISYVQMSSDVQMSFNSYVQKSVNESIPINLLSPAFYPSYFKLSLSFSWKWTFYELQYLTSTRGISRDEFEAHTLRYEPIDPKLPSYFLTTKDPMSVYFSDWI